MHGTLRRKNRKYGERVFGGRGKGEAAGTEHDNTFMDYSTGNIIPFGQKKE